MIIYFTLFYFLSGAVTTFDELQTLFTHVTGYNDIKTRLIDEAEENNPTETSLESILSAGV